jgi:hypothetical protein
MRRAFGSWKYRAWRLNVSVNFPGVGRDVALG